MTVFLSHAPTDAAIAEALETVLERRGFFVERDDGTTALRPVSSNDVVVMLLSKDFVFAPSRLRLEQRALDAWAAGRLVLVKLDPHFAPVGLRDLPFIDASFAQRHEFTWLEVADAVRERLLRPEARAGGPPPDEDEDEAPAAPPPQPPAAKQGGPNFAAPLAALALMLPGLVAAAAIVSIWLAGRIGPTPGGGAELGLGIDAFGARFGLPPGVTLWLFIAAIVLMLATFGALVLRVLKRGGSIAARTQPAPAPPPEAPASEGAAAPEEEAVFVSYARANATFVLPVIEQAGQDGARKFWLDQNDIASGESWAGEIVRAIREARDVMVMCSAAAFESDHVKREVYLADRYHKRLVPIYVEAAEPPADFEYFFAGVQALKLFETPEPERSAAVLRALGAAPA